MACAAVALAILLTTGAQPAAAAGKPNDGPCANRLCTKYVANTKSCYERYNGRAKTARCFIRRAARHFGQPLSQAYYIAHRESRYNWRVTNSSSGAAGLYQFMPRTWQSTPYRKHSPYNPRWASLAAMWMWKHGGQSHWNA
jgi:soluble lytic murein transglycosylase-like protein